MCSRRKLTHLHTFSLLLESATKKEERNRSPAKKNFFTVPLNDSRPPAAKTHGRAVLLASSSPTRSVRTCTGGQIYYYYLQGLSPTESKLPAANPYRYDNSLCHTCRPDYTGLGQTWACSLPGTGDFTWLCQIISQIKSNQIKEKQEKNRSLPLCQRATPPELGLLSRSYRSIKSACPSSASSVLPSPHRQHKPVLTSRKSSLLPAGVI